MAKHHNILIGLLGLGVAAVALPPIDAAQGAGTLPNAGDSAAPVSPPIMHPPPAPTIEGSGSSAPDGLSSIADLDRGASLWLAIVPRYDPSRIDPLTNVDPIAGTAHADPLPQSTKRQIGGHLSMEVPAVTRHLDVPGIDPVASGPGNRALWFEQK